MGNARDKGLYGAASAIALTALALACRRSSSGNSTSAVATLPPAAQPVANVSAVPLTILDAHQPGEDAAPPARFDPKEGDEVLQSVNRLSLVDRACKHRHCSLTVDNNGRHWLVAIGNDRAPAAVTPLHLFTILVEPGSKKAISVAPGAMYGFCDDPIALEKWDRYATQYERYLDNKGPEPTCP